MPHQANSFKIAPWLSLPLAALVIMASYFGIFTPDFYWQETENWQAQSIAQDWVDLVLAVPILVVASLLGYSGDRLAQQVWGGTVLFLLYTFVIYCFDVHFNSLFVVYCFALGLSFYSFLYYLINKARSEEQVEVQRAWVARLTGIYFIVVAVAFYFLWFSEIIPSVVQHQRPASLEETGLPTNAVHVLDLAVLLPGLLFTGITILKGKSFGLRLAPVFLSFFILMDISIAWLVAFMNHRSLTSEITVTIAMSVMALFSLIVLILFQQNIKAANHHDH